MSTISTNGNEEMRAKKGSDLRSDLTLVGMSSYELDRALSKRIVSELIEIVKDNDPAAGKIIEGFMPEAVWRNDCLWMVSRHLFISKEMDCLWVYHSGKELSVAALPALADNFISLKGSVYPDAKDLSRAAALRNYARDNGFLAVGRIKSYRLWNGRIYDSLEMMAKIRQLYAEGRIVVNDLVMAEKKPLLYPQDAVGQLSTFTRVVENIEDFENNLRPNNSYCRTLVYPRESWCRFVEEQKIMAKNITSSVVPQSDGIFRIFISYDLEKRVFENQGVVFGNLIERVLSNFSRVHLYINGLTAPEDWGGASFVPDIHEAEREITRLLTTRFPELEIYDLFGMTLREKLRVLALCDFYAAPKGNACFIAMLMDVPGIFYGAKESTSDLGVFTKISPKSRLVPPELVRSIDDDIAMRKVSFGLDDGTRISYRMEEDALATIAAEMLSSASISITSPTD